MTCFHEDAKTLYQSFQRGKRESSECIYQWGGCVESESGVSPQRTGLAWDGESDQTILTSGSPIKR